MPIKIRYLGPSPSVNVGVFGEHAKGQEKEYPDDIAEELIATAKEQQFEVVVESDADDKKKDKKGKAD